MNDVTHRLELLVGAEHRFQFLLRLQFQPRNLQQKITNYFLNI